MFGLELRLPCRCASVHDSTFGILLGHPGNPALPRVSFEPFISLSGPMSLAFADLLVDGWSALPNVGGITADELFPCEDLEEVEQHHERSEEHTSELQSPCNL